MKILLAMGYKKGDFRYVPMYSEYVRMKGDGEKVGYIVAALAEKYGICERKVYDVVARFSKDSTVDAV